MKDKDFDLLGDITTKLAHRRASLIDEHLAKFLTEQGFSTTTFTVESMKKQLKRKGFDITMETHRYSESEVYTFKLVKVLKETSLHIPNPTINF